MLLTTLFSAAGCIDYKALVEEVLLGPEGETGFSCSGFTPSNFGLDFDPIVAKRPDGSEILGWWIPATTDGSNGTVLVSNGAALTVFCTIENVYWLADAGYNLALYDYPGMGRSHAADRNLDDFAQAGQIVADWIVSNEHNTDTPLIVMGISMGTAVSATLARNGVDDIHAVVLDSAFEVEEAGDNVAEDFNPGGLLQILKPFLRWGVLAAFPADLNLRVNIPAVPQPLLMLHGETDNLTSPETARELFDLAGVPDTFVLFEGIGHNEAASNEMTRDRYRQEILTFLDGIE
ncbi:MAG: alpha/beta fold hydrolase [Planctomycetes bacterium]|nr:alpha/beta fold hydrolase [Planctomycetota bacterium]